MTFRRDQLIEPFDLPMKLRTDSTNQKVSIEGHFPEENHRPNLQIMIGLRKTGEDDVTFSHSQDWDL